MGEKRKFRFDSGQKLGKWVGENYKRYMRGFGFPEGTVLPLISSHKFTDSEKYDAVELHKTSDSAFILGNDEILMVRRREDGMWALPSGGVDIVDVHPDSPWSLQSAPTLRRELYEETGLVALRWQRLVTGRTDRGRTIRFWRAEVADLKYVPMRLRDYVESFNRNGGSEEVVELGLFKPPEILELNLYKKGYNLSSILSAFLYQGLPIGELSQEDIARVLQNADISEWEAQSGIEHAAPDYDYYRRDFSSLRSVV
jgi:8-oxo-dGTP pyrophosphatase MutT (NUDIX family)